MIDAIRYTKSRAETDEDHSEYKELITVEIDPAVLGLAPKILDLIERYMDMEAETRKANQSLMGDLFSRRPLTE